MFLSWTILLITPQQIVGSLFSKYKMVKFYIQRFRRPYVNFVDVQLLSHARCFAIHCKKAHQASCPSVSPGVHSNSCPLSQCKLPWKHFSLFIWNSELLGPPAFHWQPCPRHRLGGWLAVQAFPGEGVTGGTHCRRCQCRSRWCSRSGPHRCGSPGQRASGSSSRGHGST